MSETLRPLRAAEAAQVEDWLRASASGLTGPGSGSETETWRAELAGASESSVAFGLESGGRLAGAALLRSWGRSLVLPLVIVDPALRGRGLGRSLLGALREEILRRDVRVAGLELPSEDLGSAAACLRSGWREAPSTWLVECEPSAPPEGEPAADPSPGFSSGDAERITRLTTALDADLDPSAWIAERVAAGAELRWMEEDGALHGLLLLPPAPEPRSATPAADSFLEPEPAPGVGPFAEDAGDAPAAPDAPSTDGHPSEAPPLVPLFAALAEEAPAGGLEALLALLREAARSRGQGRLRLAVPGRRAELLRSLLGEGFRPVGQRRRLLLAGHPERADPRRVVIADWR